MIKKRINAFGFQPFNNFVKSLPEGNHGMLLNDRIKFINKQLTPYHASWDVYEENDKLGGSNELIFEKEEHATWFILRWS